MPTSSRICPSENNPTFLRTPPPRRNLFCSLEMLRNKKTLSPAGAEPRTGTPDRPVFPDYTSGLHKSPCSGYPPACRSKPPYHIPYRLQDGRLFSAFSKIRRPGWFPYIPAAGEKQSDRGPHPAIETASNLPCFSSPG